MLVRTQLLRMRAANGCISCHDNMRVLRRSPAPVRRRRRGGVLAPNLSWHLPHPTGPLNTSSRGLRARSARCIRRIRGTRWGLAQLVAEEVVSLGSARRQLPAPLIFATPRLGRRAS